MANAKLNLLVLKTCQVERLVHFYFALGINFQSEQHGKGPAHYAGKIGADLVLEIYPLFEGQPDATIRLGFVVENLDTVIGSLEAAGAPVVTPPRHTEWGLEAVVRDPDGRNISITQPG